MGDVWLRTISNSLIRAESVTEIASTRGTLHEEQGFSLKVIVQGKAHLLIDDGDLQGSLSDRLEYARHLEDALLLAIDGARIAVASVVVSFEPERQRWSMAAAPELAGGLANELKASL
jgi:hypothetical protein